MADPRLPLRISMSRLLFVLALMVAGLLPGAGCGSGRPKCSPVTGIVTYLGKPVEGAGVTFMPKGGRPSTGKTDEQGRFTLMSFSPGDGAMPGEHVVCIAKSIRDPKDKTNSPYPKEISVLPARYAAPTQSQLKATVTAGGPNEFRFDLTD